MIKDDVEPTEYEVEPIGQLAYETKTRLLSAIENGDAKKARELLEVYFEILKL